MTVSIDRSRGKQAAELLFEAFATTGIHGRTDMPEDVLPNTARGSLEHILFITLTVAIDYQRDANVLWESARRTFNDPETRYLFNPQALTETPLATIVHDMKRYKLSKKQQKDAEIWTTVGRSFYKKWQGDPSKFLEYCGWQALAALGHLKMDTHLDGGQRVDDFPYLRGDKIGPLWLRMLRDNANVMGIKNLERVPIPVDIHIGRATLALGIVRGIYTGRFEYLFEEIRKAWFESVLGLRVGEREMMALDVDEPLWHLSKYGCTFRDKQSGECPMINSCEAKELCVPGKIEIWNSTTIEVVT